jgi:hypothetical protein
MSINNKTNLPKPIVDWLSYDEYDHESDTISATKLLKSPRQVILEKRHKDELEIDVSELVSSKFGTAIHNSFELAFKDKPEYRQEERHYKTVNIDGTEFKVSGKFDFILNNIIHDIKTTSTWTYVFGSNDQKYIEQLSIYRWLLQDTIDIEDTCKIVFVFTDWSKSKARQDKSYPQFRVATKDYKLMSIEETNQFVRSKLENIHTKSDVPDSELPYCTDEELWKDSDTFAVFKKRGAKRATKVFNNLDEAMKYQRDQSCFTVEHRKGGVNACNYCNVSKFCNQYKMLESQGLIKQ